MTSQLNVDTIVDKAGSGGSNVKMANTSTYVSEGGAKTANSVVQGLLKMWVMCEGSASVQDSFNVSSSTDLGTGSYQYNFTNNLSNTDYAQLSCSRQGNADNGTNVSGQATTHCSTLIRMYNSTSTFDAFDCNGVAGDLA